MMKVRVSRPLRSILSPIAAVISCSLLLLAAGCGSVGPGSSTQNPTAPTVTIAANPTSIAAGGSSTLTVAATNATAVTVTGDDGSSYTLATTGGTQVVKPAKTTTYTATATGAAGTTAATATATVTITGTPPAKPTVTVSANPTTITAGSASTLTIAATNATSVTVAGSDSTNFTLPTPTGGSLKVSPVGTTTYTVTATGAGGSATATATVTVTPAPPPPPTPTVTLTANPTTIVAGSSTTLTVTATNATSLVIAGSDGTSFTSPALPVAGGTETVSPTTTTNYTVTATGPGGSATAAATVTVTQPPTPTVTITASPSSIASGNSSTLTVAATNATSVTVTGTDKTSYTLSATGGAQSVSPASTTTYTATADGAGGTTPATATATVTVVPPGTVKSLNHVIFMLQENHTFDNYFGMLNTYRQNHGYDKGDDGNTYDVDGIEDKVNGEAYDALNKSNQVISNKDKQGGVHTLYKFKSTCIDDASSAWSESFGDVSLGNYLPTRPIRMNGYVSNGDGFANSKCAGGVGPCTGFTDTTGDRTMGYYDDGYLNYYYYMASQFALSDRWFSPIESKSIPNRIATFTGGTTQGLTQDPGGDDHLNTLSINNIFQELDNAKPSPVSWKVYYTVTNAQCDPEDCKPGSTLLPATTFSYLSYSFKYVGGKPSDPGGCISPKQPDSSNSFCVDPHHIAYLKDPTFGYFADLKNGTLPSFVFIESGSGLNDEHPGYQQTILAGQFEVASIINALMTSTDWQDSAFFLAYDEGGGPYDHVPPVPGHTNDFTDAATVKAGNYPTDVTQISVQPDSFYPCVPAAAGDLHCDLRAGQPGSNTGDAAAPPPGSGFGAQVGFRVPDMVVSPFARKHYVSHIPMDHTAVIKFVEDRFIGNGKYLTARDAAQPNLLDFFDFTGVPWATPPTPPAAITNGSFPSTTCTPASLK
ncbi:MAG TPA: alkaline phosphatase family protein [Terracidiphilus sp.]